MGVLDPFLASKAGPSGSLAYTTGPATAALKVIQSVQGPILLMLRSTTNVHLLQGGSDVGAPTTDDFMLFANNYYPLLIEYDSDSYIRAIGATASGTLVITNISNLNITPQSA